MEEPAKPRTIISLPGQRIRAYATKLLGLHPLHSQATIDIQPPLPSCITIVCISDTHNKQPGLPDGDLLIHAGDLTENGSFDEVQAQLKWLSSQPHRHKVVIAGNHDVLFDPEFLEKYPERTYGQLQSLHDLEWGDIHYLQDSSVTLSFPFPTLSNEHDGAEVLLKIFGSPSTPQYGISAFQYPLGKDKWRGVIPADTDIVVTHGPPSLHLDKVGVHRAGCPYLAREIAHIRPRLMIFGHIHVANGREDVVLDRARRYYEEIMGDWAGWGTLVLLAGVVLMANVRSILVGRENMAEAEKHTTFVNAAMVGGWNNELRNEPIVFKW